MKQIKEEKMLLLPTSYFPNIKYFRLISEYNEIEIEIYEHFPKQTYRNRCEILGANGIMSLIVPVLRGRTGKIFTKDIKISYINNWQKQHFQSLKSAYASAPFYEHYIADIESLFIIKPKFLIELNQKILHIISKLLSFDKKIDFTDDFRNLNNADYIDFRFEFSPKLKEDNSIKNKYIQVFSDRFDFVPNLSILDLIFNLGPESRNYLTNVEC